MHFAYYDEAGDDGFPQYSSPIFVLTTLYLHHLNWKDTYEAILAFRRDLKDDFAFPVKLEMHSRYFLLNKRPYKRFDFDEHVRVEIFGRFCELVGALDLRIVNVAILKPLIKNPTYQVLDTSLKFSVQRLENDLDPEKNPNAKFLIITDTGRVGKMRKTTRRIQRINYIPSKFSSQPYRREIRAMVEDPLPKDSKESYFIQLADVVAQVVYYHSLLSKSIAALPNRLRTFVDAALLAKWLDAIKPSLNLQAAGDDAYGIRFHPT